MYNLSSPSLPWTFRTSLQARLAQSVERKALNLVVVASSPRVGVYDLVWQMSLATAKLICKPTSESTARASHLAWQTPPVTGKLISKPTAE